MDHDSDRDTNRSVNSDFSRIDNAVTSDHRKIRSRTHDGEKMDYDDREKLGEKERHGMSISGLLLPFIRPSQLCNIEFFHL